MRATLALNGLKYRSSHPEVFLEKGVLKICSKFTGEHPCRSVISIKLLCTLKSHFSKSAFLWICCIFLEQLLLRTHLGICFWKCNASHVVKCSTHYNHATKHILNCSLNISPPSSFLVTTIINISDNNIPRSLEDATLTRSKKRKEN